MAVNNQLNSATVPFPVFKNVVDISSAQVLAMYTSPVLLVPSPGANKIIFVHDVFIEYAFGGVAYANGSGISIQYTGSLPGDSILNSNINPQGSASDFGGDPGVPFQTFGAIESYINQGVCASTVNNNFTGGNGTFRVSIFYTIVATTT